jgi:transposase
MTRVADVADAVIGGDTHSGSHTLEMLSPTGVVIATTVVANNHRGCAATLAFIAEHAPGPRIVVGLEGSRSYGIGLSRALAAAGLPVVEVDQPGKKSRRGKGKSDPIDAHHAAVAVLAMDVDRLPTPRADGDREALRILLVGRREMTDTRTRQANALRALLRTGDDIDRELADGAWTKTKLTAIMRRRGRAGETREQRVRRGEARRLSAAILSLDVELARNQADLTAIVRDIAAVLLDRTGIGPVSAAQAIVTFSHVGRCRNDAALAALAGTSPNPASSGNVERHRLNRGGDRQLNKAIHVIVQTRMRTDPRTRDYVTRRTAEGKSKPEIRRCLKRYVTRELFRALTAAMA